MLALSFATYGCIRKVVRVEALPGLAAETLLLAAARAGYLIWCEGPAAATSAMRPGHRWLLVIGSGPLTAVPLFLFAYGARRIPYSTVGLLQYIAPTLQLACGVFVLHESFGRDRARWALRSSGWR